MSHRGMARRYSIRMMKALAGLTLVALAGCGKSGTVSCDYSATAPRCEERVQTIDVDDFELKCSAAAGTPKSGACPAEGKSGGCALGPTGDGSVVNDWYYAPLEQTDISQICFNDSATFLPP